MNAFFRMEPDQLPGEAGAWLRGEAELPSGADWLPHPARQGRQRARKVGGGIGTVLLLGLAAVLQPPWNIFASVTAVAALWVSRIGRRDVEVGLQGPGRHGLLLLDDQLLYRVGTQCAVIPRLDITGVERRVSPMHGVIGAFTLSARTGRGALPSPAPGKAAHAKMVAWWQAT